MFGFKKDLSVEQRNERERAMWFIGGVIFVPAQIWYTIIVSSVLHQETNMYGILLSGIIAIAGMIIWPLMVRQDRLKHEDREIDHVISLSEVQSVIVAMIAGFGLYTLLC